MGWSEAEHEAHARHRAVALNMQPVASFDRIHKFTRAVTLLQQCGRIDVQQPGSFSARSTEIIAAKSAAAAVCTAMLLGHPTARELLQRLESNLDILQVLPRINQALDDPGSDLVNASHIVRDFLFIGAASRGSNCIMSSAGAPQEKSAAFFEMNSIKCVINVARELCPPSSSFNHDIPYEALTYPLTPDLTLNAGSLNLIKTASPSDFVLVHVPMKDEDPWCLAPNPPHYLFLPDTSFPRIRSSELESYLTTAGSTRHLTPTLFAPPPRLQALTHHPPSLFQPKLSNCLGNAIANP